MFSFTPFLKGIKIREWQFLGDFVQKQAELY